MPVSKKKPITLSSEGSTSEASSPVLPEQEEFRQHLRRLAVSAVQVLIEQVMREELEQCLGASWGEVTPTRRGYRNGSYTRDLVTSTGRIENLTVPRDREGEFHSQVFERYQRYEPEVAEALTQMFVSGVVFVNDIGDQFLIRFGATVSIECGNAHQIRGPFDNEKRDHLAFDNRKGSHLSLLCPSCITTSCVYNPGSQKDPRD